VTHNDESGRRYPSALTEQIVEQVKIAMMTKQIIEHFRIRSVSDGSAWGWGPTRTK